MKKLNQAISEAHHYVDSYFISWDGKDVIKRELFREYNLDPTPEKYENYFQAHLEEVEAYKQWRNAEVQLEDLLEEKNRREYANC